MVHWETTQLQYYRLLKTACKNHGLTKSKEEFSKIFKKSHTRWGCFICNSIKGWQIIRDEQPKPLFNLLPKTKESGGSWWILWWIKNAPILMQNRPACMKDIIEQWWIKNWMTMKLEYWWRNNFNFLKIWSDLTIMLSFFSNIFVINIQAQETFLLFYLPRQTKILHPNQCEKYVYWAFWLSTNKIQIFYNNCYLALSLFFLTSIRLN